MPSKLAPHHLTSNAATWLIMLAGALWIKCVDDFGNADKAKKEIGTHIRTIGRRNLDYPKSTLNLDFANLQERFRDNPEGAATYWMGLMRPYIDLNPFIDFWELLNEPVCEVSVDKVVDRAKTIFNIQWLSRFSIECMKQLEALGKHAVIGIFSTGTLDINAASQWQWDAFLPALQYANDHGHLLGLHEYFNNIGRYRLVYQYVFVPHKLTDLKIVLVEFSYDDDFTKHSDDDWVAHMIAADQELQKDSYLLVATIFSYGSNNDRWNSYDMGRLPNRANPIRDYVKSQVGQAVPIPTPAPTPTPTPTPTPAPTPTLPVLVNPGFEENSMNGWGVWGAEQGTPMLNQSAPKGRGHQDQPWRAPTFGARRYTDFQEGRALVSEGDYACHIRQPEAPAWVELYRYVDLPAGQFKFLIDVLPDVVVKYLPGNLKQYPKAGDSDDWYLAFEAGFYVGDQMSAGVITSWLDARSLPFGQYSTLEATVTLTKATKVQVRAGGRCRWGFQGVGWLFDNLRYQQITSLPEPDPDPAPIPEPAPQPTPTGLAYTTPAGLNMRASFGLNAAVLEVLPKHSPVLLTGSITPRDSDGIVWAGVRSVKHGEGWCSLAYLEVQK